MVGTALPLLRIRCIACVLYLFESSISIRDVIGRRDQCFLALLCFAEGAVRSSELVDRSSVRTNNKMLQNEVSKPAIVAGFQQANGKMPRTLVVDRNVSLFSASSVWLSWLSTPKLCPCRRLVRRVEAGRGSSPAALHQRNLERAGDSKQVELAAGNGTLCETESKLQGPSHEGQVSV